MSENFTPLLTTTDWNEEWKRLQIFRKAADDASFWDKKAPAFGTKATRSPYAEHFVRLTALRPAETVFDMGCGNGAITIPLAEEGHRVIAADFSQGMLECLEKELAFYKVSGVRPIKMSWTDDWSAYGITKNCADIAVASRSVATTDLRDSLLRLSAIAKRRVCITLSAGGSPRCDTKLLDRFGLQRYASRDFPYAFAILLDEGFLPEVSYITSSRYDTFDSLDEAEKKYIEVLRSAAWSAPEEKFALVREQLHIWLANQLEKNPDAGKGDGHAGIQGAYRVSEPRTTTWAFIAWNVEDYFGDLP